MKLYKLRSLENDGLFFALDMIINARIYLSTCEEMNDIGEGSFDLESPSDFAGNQSLIETAREIIDQQRFTCFVSRINNPLMWAHYACGFRGIAFEYELDAKRYDIRDISYNGKPTVSITSLNDICEKKIPPQDVNILRSKDSCWEYEDEYRLYNTDKYVNEKPCSIILGARGSKFDSIIRDIASKYSIRLGYLHPSEDGYEASYKDDYEIS